MALVDKGLHQLDHLADLLGGLRAHVGIHDAGGAHVADEGIGELRGDLGGGAAFLVCLGDDLIVDIGDVLHEGHLIAAIHEVAANGVEGDKGAGVADVDAVVDRWSADVHAHLALFNGLELFLLVSLGVVKLNHGVLLGRTCVKERCVAAVPARRLAHRGGFAHTLFRGNAISRKTDLEDA